MPPYVLVVESDASLQRLIADALREANYELATEREAAWAERSLLVRAPDAMVVDTQLPDGPGFRVAEALRKDPEAREVPIYFIASRHPGQAHATEARRRFAPAEYLPAPFDLNTLLARLLARVPPPPRPRAPSTPPVAPPAVATPDRAQLAEARVVERQSRKLSEGTREPELSGSLGRQSFAQLLRRLYSGRRTGALLLVRGTTKKLVYFRDGYPTSVRSNLLSECLGQILLAQRRLAPEQVELSIARMKQERRQQGEILVEMGMLSPHGLEQALVEQLEVKLFDLFSWQDGTFAFREDMKPPGDGIALPRAPAALILEGIRRHYDEARQEQILSAFSGRFPVPTADPLMQLQDLTADPNERRFIQGVDGTQMLEAILNVPPIPRERARAILCAMIEAGMVQASDEPIEAAAVAPAARGRRALTPPPPAGGKEAAELAPLLEAMRGQTHFEVLGLAPEAEAAEIESAYVRLARAFHPDAYRARQPQVRALVAQIFERLGEARAVLRDPTRRLSYLRRLERARSTPGVSDKALRAAEQGYYAGIEHLRARRFAEAIEALGSAIALVPGQASYHGTLGWALYRQAPADPAQTARARAELERAVALDPDDPWLRVSLGRFLAETGQVAPAIASLEAALALRPDLPDIAQEVRRLRGEGR